MRHVTRPVRVWADIDEGIVDAVLRLNKIPGVRTFASCQGTIDEAPSPSPEHQNPYRPYVLSSWLPEACEEIAKYFDIELIGENHGYLHPKTRRSGAQKKSSA